MNTLQQPGELAQVRALLLQQQSEMKALGEKMARREAEIRQTTKLFAEVLMVETGRANWLMSLTSVNTVSTMLK